LIPAAVEVTFGRILFGCNEWTVDAQPFVMSKLRALFPRARSTEGRGQYTHRPIVLPATASIGKDLRWFSERYPMVLGDEARIRLDRDVQRYDEAVRAAAVGDTQRTFDLSPVALRMAEPPRPHQVGFRNLALGVRRLLLADELGLGKTISAISLLPEPDARPALIVVPTHLTRQWANQLSRFLPEASVHTIRGRRVYELPKVDVLITAYSRLLGWEDVLVPLAPRTLILDEVQDLRHVATTKRTIARALSLAAERCVGLSATPIYNYGAEIWSVIDVISPDVLGPREEFVKEWCTSDHVNDTLALHTYLASQGLMLRRTRADLGIQADPVSRDVVTLEGNLESLEEVRDVARSLALSVLSNRVGESDDAARELDWKLRQATGIAKAKPVAEFVRMLVESGEKVLLVGWHRAVYDTWLKELRHLHPVMYTGTESGAQKAAAVRDFTEGGAQVFILSQRSGAGLDGLQKVCKTVVFGELDWSPQVMEQVIGRLDREGQEHPVSAYFLTIDDGADPFMLQTLGVKQSQSDGVVAGIEGRADLLEAVGTSDRLREMAMSYLVSIGEAPPSPEPEFGLHAEVVSALRGIALPSSTEREMQDALWSVLPARLPFAKVEREVRIGERGRLDFLVSVDEEQIAIECKIDQTGRASVYRQVRRYAEHADVTGVVILAPWSGVSSFVVDETPVTVVDWSKQTLRRGGR
jgi:hypothetical protein